MKKYILLSLVFLLGLIQGAKASHLAGADLWYEFNGTNYTINVTYSKMCTGYPSLWLEDDVTVWFISPSLKDTFTRTLHVLKKDTMAVGCGPSSCDSVIYQNTPAHIVWYYADTVTIPPAPDWVIGTTLSEWAPTTNLIWRSSKATGEAFLNNLNGNNNSSALLPNGNAYVIEVNKNVRIPMPVSDVDGDSIVCELVAPKFAHYQTGYSVGSPFGTGANLHAIDNAKKDIVFRCVNQGVYAMSVKINEYRNGVLISYRTKDFVVFCIQNTNKMSSIRQLGNPAATTCPGQTNSFSFDFESDDVNDTVYLEVVPVSSTPFTIQSTVVQNKNRSTILTGWVTPANFTASNIIFNIRATAKQGNCITALATYAVVVKVGSCVQDSVWAGDANDDNVANIFDVLPIAMNYGARGYTRPFRSLNWVPQYSADWGRTWTWMNKNIDLKHIDCNGDGLIDSFDLDAISVNYSKTHNKEGVGEKTTSGPALYYDANGLDYSPGATVSLPIKLGAATMPANDVYAVLANMRVEGITLPQQMVLNTNNSWMTGVDPAVNFIKNNAINSIDWVQGRTDKQNISGDGTIATLNFTIPANTAVGTMIYFKFSDAMLYNKDGNVIANFSSRDTSVVIEFPTGIAPQHAVYGSVSIVPNPSGSDAQLYLSMLQAQHIQVVVTDITGKQLWTASEQMNKGTQRITLPASGLPAGVYMVRVADEQGVQQTLKWVKR